MKMKRKSPVGVKQILSGILIAWIVTMALVAICAYMIQKEILPIRTEKINGYIICGISSLVCCLIVARTSSNKPLAFGAGGIYYLTLLVCALIFGGGLSVKTIIVLPVVFAGCIFGIMVGSRHKRKSVPRIK